MQQGLLDNETETGAQKEILKKNDITEHLKFGAGYSSFRRVSLNRIRKEMNRYVINHEGSTTASDEYNEAMIIVIYLQVFEEKKNTYVSYIL